MQKSILVVGSFVEDLIVQTSKFPASGESVIGNKFSRADGGKGANQAVQIARLNTPVKIIGKVGSDSFSKSLVSTCLKSGVNVEEVIQDEGNPGISVVVLEEVKEGFQNRIIMTPGANNRLTVEDVKYLENEIENYEAIVLQFEIPQEVNDYLAEIAYKKGVKVIVNPAPYREVSDEFLKNVTYLIPNETEFLSLIKSNKNIDEFTENDFKEGAKILLDKGVKNVIITLGSKGCCIANKENCQCFESVKNVKSVDPTAAGDSFIGAFTSFLSRGYSEKEAILLANAVGSLTVQKLGAMPSLCTLEELTDYVKGLKYAPYKGLYALLKNNNFESVDVLDVFKSTVLSEITYTLGTLNKEFYESALDLILKAKENGNRVHITGIGKPSHIAQYFASLFSSTGTPTYYLHGTEAVHGSCGQLVRGDVVIAISNSGNTSELINTIEACKRNGCKIIGVTGNESSKLAKLSDAHLLAHIENEGGPLNRAPRSSILAETLVLQGLSVLLQEDAKVTPKQYVKWHPGGALGKIRDNEK